MLSHFPFFVHLHKNHCGNMMWIFIFSQRRAKFQGVDLKWCNCWCWVCPVLVSPQNRPSVITCASANNRNCNLSHCPIAHSACSGAAYRRPSSCKCPQLPPCPPTTAQASLHWQGEKELNNPFVSWATAEYSIELGGGVLFSCFEKLIKKKKKTTTKQAPHTDK